MSFLSILIVFVNLEKSANVSGSITASVANKVKATNVNVLNMLKSAATNKNSNESLESPTNPDENGNVQTTSVTSKQAVEKKPKPNEVNVLNMLKNAAISKKSTGLQTVPIGESIISEGCVEPAVSQFDADVLAQLPEEIRRDILCYPDEYLRMSTGQVRGAWGNGNDKRKQRTNMKRKSRSRSSSRTPSPPPLPPLMRIEHSNASLLNESDLKPSTSRAALAKQSKQAGACRADQIVAAYVQELPQHMHPAIMQFLAPGNTISKAPATPQANAEAESINKWNALLDPNYKSILATWVTSEEVPTPADVDLMYINISALVEDNQMEKVYEVMKYLCRLIKAKRPCNCHWHMAYNVIESNVQEKVHESLDCHIYFTEAIDCYKCT